MLLLGIAFHFVMNLCLGWAGEHQEIEQHIKRFHQEITNTPQPFEKYIDLASKMEAFFSDNEECLRQYCEQKKYALWPNQKNWIQVLIGEVFYPKHEIEDIYEAYGGISNPGDWVLSRRPIMARLAIAAGKGNPVATFYLGCSFYETRYLDKDESPIASLYELAFRIFENTSLQESHPYCDKAKYFMAKGYSKHIRAAKMDVNTASKYLSDLNHREACLLNLVLYELERSKVGNSDFTNFLELGDNQKYALPFYKVFDLFTISFDEGVNLLEKAIKTVPHPLLYMKLASLYQNEFKYSPKKTEIYNGKVLDCLKEAASLGSPVAYRKMAELLVPYKIVGSYFKFEEAESVKDLQLCEDYLKKAAELGLPEAYYNLALLTEEYIKRQTEDSEFEESKFKDEIQFIMESYKRAVQEGCYKPYTSLTKKLEGDVQFFDDYPDLNEQKQRFYKHVLNHLSH